MIRVSIDHYWNDDWQGKTKVLKKKKPDPEPVVHNLTQAALRFNLGIHSKL